MLDLIQVDNDNSWEFHDTKIDSTSYDELDSATEHWHQGNADLSETILRKIISKNNNNIDALHHLSLVYYDTGREFEAYLCCRESVRVGLAVLPEEFIWGESKLEWHSLSNRPFLRAYHNLGLWLQTRKEIKPAIKVFTNILKVSPNDNIGVRYLLPQLLLENDDLSALLELCEEYSDDTGPELLYTYPLALLALGEYDKAKTAINEAKEQLPLVAVELLKSKHKKPKSEMPGYITHGGAEQAYGYWKNYGHFWKQSKTAKELLSN